MCEFQYQIEGDFQGVIELFAFNCRVLKYKVQKHPFFVHFRTLENFFGPLCQMQHGSYVYREYLFDEELWGLCTNEDWWPKERTQKMFWQWFDVEFHSMVSDPYDLPIEKEDL